MSADEFSDYTKDDVIKLMVACGASKDSAETTVTAQATKLDTALKKLAEHSFNTIPTTMPKVVVGHFHFRLRKAITNSIKLVSSLLTAGIGLVAFPVLPPLGASVAALGGASAVATAIDTISDLFTKMTDEELYVYQSILDIANNDRHNNTDVAKNLTVDRLKKWFTDHYEAPPPHLDAILAAMQKKEEGRTKNKRVRRGSKIQHYHLVGGLRAWSAFLDTLFLPTGAATAGLLWRLHLIPNMMSSKNI